MENFDLKKIVEKQRKFFNSNATKNIDFRLQNLKLLEKKLNENYSNFVVAFKEDYNKCEFDMLSTEFSMVIKELHFMQKKLKKLAKPKRVGISIINFGAKGYIYSEPYGVTLIVAPWNYPLQLSLIPVIDAIATGNTIILKLSANTPNISKIIENVLSSFNDEYIYITKPEEKEQIFSQKYDFCFYTGSTIIGKELLKNQAENLTPCVLELGGKSPCIIDSDANIEISAKRLVWGKFLNAGQTCVAPDYALIHNDIKDKLIEKMKEYIQKFYYENGNLKDTFTSIINQKQSEKIKELISNENVIIGGNFNGKILEPTVLDNINFFSPIMQEEIFAPVLPIISFNNIDEIIKTLKTKERPLALYYFGKQNAEKVITELNYGGGAINDTIMHLTEEKLPFGGIGFSGMGSYHGKKSFETFSHYKSVLKKGNTELNTKYPPYNRKKIKLIKLLFGIKNK